MHSKGGVSGTCFTYHSIGGVSPVETATYTIEHSGVHFSRVCNAAS